MSGPALRHNTQELAARGLRPVLEQQQSAELVPATAAAPVASQCGLRECDVGGRLAGAHYGPSAKWELIQRVNSEDREWSQSEE